MAQSRTSPAIFSFDFQFRPFSTAAGTRSRVPAEVPGETAFIFQTRPGHCAGSFHFIGAYSMTQEEEYTIRSQLKWKRDGSDWVLLRGRRRMGRVTPDVQYAGMWRSPKSGGRVSDMANLSWAKDAGMTEGIRELAWKTRQHAA